MPRKRGTGTGTLATIQEEPVTVVPNTPTTSRSRWTPRLSPTWKSIFIAAFTGIGGLLFGYDTGYINGVMAMPYFENFNGKPPIQPAWFRLPVKDKSLIVGLLSLGTCVGSLVGSDVADYLGRRIALMGACALFIYGVVNQTVSTHMDMLGRGRVETGVGMGMISTVIVLYMSEISGARVRGFLVAWYQLCITMGLLMAACVNLGTRDMWSTWSFRIPISLQIGWALILGVGLLWLLPESPRWYVKMGKHDEAQKALARLRCQEPGSDSVKAELRYIIAGHEAEMRYAPSESKTYLGSWAHCFQGRLRDKSSNLRRTLLGAAVQMFQQVSGVNFIFYFGTVFFKQQRFNNVFLIVVIMSAINVLATFFSFYLVTRFRRRTLLIAGAFAMAVCQIVVAGVGVGWKENVKAAASVRRLTTADAAIPQWASWATMTGVGAYLFLYAVTWGPGAWILVGEIFPMQIRARGIGIATSTNWLTNTIFAFLTPVLYDSNHLNLGTGVFFIWGGACFAAALFSYWFVPETKGLTLEQVDIIFEVPARRSGYYIPIERKASQAIPVRRDSESIALNDHPNTKKPASVRVVRFENDLTSER
ncbi:general substrate transporter [Rhypophila decipiens]|uniref:General substrate transporter n=1 Tax=Rhypophila decipiens TaxID=261697 RepID=A0AAN7B7G3_9PEZI|nr:general substrate transporter [Rhypophila decipiens]